VAAWYQLAIAFGAFGLVASSAYVMNDLLDLEADRQHATKRHRMFAAGELSLMHGIIAAPLLLATGAALALVWLPRGFAVVLGLYFVATCVYSLSLKSIAVLDVTLLAALYVARVIAGGAAVAVPISFWFLAFSLFLFFSLALAKRSTELADLPEQGPQAVPRRGYRRDDLPLLRALGVASGFMAALVLALYINSPESQVLYTQPKMLWLLVPFFMMWIALLWLRAQRRELHEDPVVYALTDPASLALGGLTALALVLAT
jgi:4-hydroxybenzoate polyprenyltransferase